MQTRGKAERSPDKDRIVSVLNINHNKNDDWKIMIADMSSFLGKDRKIV
jgi:hypothetical protein